MCADGRFQRFATAAKGNSGKKATLRRCGMQMRFSVDAETRQFGIAALEVPCGGVGLPAANRQMCHHRNPGPDHATQGHGENCAHLEGAVFDNMQT